MEPYMVLSMFLLVSVLAKLMFHSAHWLSTMVPESCVLILVGLIFGGVLFAGEVIETKQILFVKVTQNYFVHQAVKLRSCQNFPISHRNYFSTFSFLRSSWSLPTRFTTRSSSSMSGPSYCTPWWGQPSTFSSSELC